ncbi:kinase-like domain-containing protein [Clohesyomyces aquaticus]|uniref:Kinase-like domain-containing protein n=1 Tax=Clohesyomyces aquaticus TaxID=1231657 RepID=A0A1Y2A258_9PLEO|nr:kinase-like domain-containing protein [Clohesyomyces aquaticus]
MTVTVRRRVVDESTVVHEISGLTLNKETLDKIPSDNRVHERLRASFPNLDIEDEDFITAKTSKTLFSATSKTTYHTAPSGTIPKPESLSNRLPEDHEYAKLLESKNLWPVDGTAEKDWSNRGQHAEFLKSERNLLNAILEVRDILGSTRTAVVQSVLCKRILLARKTIQCNRRFTKEQAIEEVAHLTRLQHSHILQVIGTYTMDTTISILLYPVADYNLSAFLDRLTPDLLGIEEWNRRKFFLRRSFGCLSYTVCYIHQKLVKHMDIKPQNVLVRHIQGTDGYRIYIADFGIARSYQTLEESDTEGYTLFTRKYSAPEVVDKATRGLGADVFSLGCVFLEIAAALARAWSSLSTVSLDRAESEWDRICHLDDLLKSNEYDDSSYQANIEPLQILFNALQTEDRRPCDDLQHIWKIISQMMTVRPEERPSSAVVAKWLVHHRGGCCRAVSEPLEAAKRF